MAGLEAAIEATRNFRNEVLELQAALDALPLERTVTIRYDTQGTADAAAADAMRIASEAAYADAAAQEADRAATEANTASALDNARAKYLLAMADRMQANTARDAAAANAAGAAAGGGGGGFLGRFNITYPLFGGLLGSGAAGSVSALHIILDAAFESAIALGEALAALAVGLAAMAPAAGDVYTHLSSVYTVSEALHQTIPPLNGWFEQLQHAMAPQTVEAYGGALALVNSNGSVLARIAGEVVTGLDDWIARLDEFMSANKGTGQILQDGVGFLTQFREAVDNVGIALHNLLAADPGTAHYLMDLVVAGTRLLDVITEIPAPVLEAALALHSFWLWGGLLATQAVKLLNPLRAMAVGMGEVAAAETAVTAAGKDATGMTLMKATVADIGTGFATWGKNIGTAVTEAEGMGKVGAGLGAAFSFVNPVALGIAALAAGVGYLTYEMMQSSQASQQFAQSVNTAFTSGGATSFLTQVPVLAAQGMSGLTASINQQADAWKSYNIAAHQTVSDIEHGNVPAMLESGAKAIGDFFSAAVHGQQAQNSIGNYTGALAKLSAGTANLLHDMDPLVKQGYSVSQSFALMDLAGVQASDSFALAQTKIQNLIHGYAEMSVQGGILAGAVNAVTFASEQQDSKVQQLTQAYSTWFSTITGGESTFTSFAQQTVGLYQALTTSGLKVTDSNGKVNTSLQLLASGAGDTAASMTGLNSASLNAQNTFLQTAQAAQNQFNSLLTLSSAAGLGSRGTQMLTGAMRDYMAILMPTAGNNKALQQTLVSMYQEVNPNIKTWGQLAGAVGSVKNPLQSLQNTTTAFTVAAGNLTQDVQNLAAAIGQNLNQAMSAAILQANGGQKAFDDFATAMLNGHSNAKQMTDAAFHLAEKLIQVTGNTKTAEGEFVTFATQMGLSKSAAEQLWNSVESGAVNADNQVTLHANHITQAIDSIPSTKNIEFVISTVGSTGVINAGPVKAAAEGWRVPGYGGGDRVPAMLEPGEAVVPKHLVPAVAPFLGAHHVPGFAAGGRVGNMSDVFALWAHEMWAHDLAGHGRGHPIPEAAMKALLAAVTQPRKLKGIWEDPQYRDFARDLKADMGGYAGKDLEYWSLMALAHPAMTKARKAEIAHLEHEMHLHTLKHQPGWVRYYEKKLHALEHPETAKDAAELALLQREGFSRGGLVRSYDSGGYLPVGLSMAYNGTGRPEPVGGAAAHSTRPLVNRIELDGRVLAEQLTPHLVASVSDYNYMNTGMPTGKLNPGP